jgi:hypothetical protein
MVLDWPSETVLAGDKIEQWYQPGSNRVLDFHGDPMKANLGLIKDGGLWGEQFISFMQGETVARIYGRHGLQHKCDVHPAARSD